MVHNPQVPSVAEDSGGEIGSLALGSESWEHDHTAEEEHGDPSPLEALHIVGIATVQAAASSGGIVLPLAATAASAAVPGGYGDGAVDSIEAAAAAGPGELDGEEGEAAALAAAGGIAGILTLLRPWKTPAPGRRHRCGGGSWLSTHGSRRQGPTQSFYCSG